MLGTGLSLWQPALMGAPPFTPASLSPLYWAGGYSPAEGRLWQDVEQTSPVLTAGTPVALAIPKSGTVHAQQEVALSRPLLGRAPSGGVRNVATGGHAMGTSTYWVGSRSNQGVSIERIWTGEIDGIPVARYQLSGTATGNGVIGFNQPLAMQVPINIGDSFTVSMFCRTVTGGEVLTESYVGPRANAIGRNSSGGQTPDNSPSDPNRTSEWKKVYVTRSVSNTNTVYASPSAEFRYTTGLDLSGVIVEVSGLQMELGSSVTAMQYNLGVENVVEPGVPSHWYLFDDGGDRLDVTIPAGYYEAMWVDYDSGISFGGTTIPGTFPVSLLFSTRQIDVIVLDRAFTDDERAKIADYWAERFAT